MVDYRKVTVPHFYPPRDPSSRVEPGKDAVPW